MARDYKSRAAAKQGRKPVSAWVWLTLGIVIGAVGVGLACIKYAPAPEPGTEWVGAPPANKKAAAAPKKPVRQLEFDFYNLLPDQEVLVSDDELDPRPPPVQKPAPAQPEKKPPVKKGRRYLVQVSSFRNAREAEALKAKLGLLGLRARVSRAQIKGATWYRVQLGPFPDQASMQDVRKQLASGGYNSLAIALK